MKNDLQNESAFAPSNKLTGLTQVDALLQLNNLSDEIKSALLKISSVFKGDGNQVRPFLTVILRTQGRRIEPLKDALLCLCAQTDQDFEVVVVDHDSDAEGALAVRTAVDTQPSTFRSRIRIVEVSGGTRSKPLNQALLESDGSYIAVFDDDDLLFADWVEQFHDSVLSGNVGLLRAQTATQQAAPEVWPNGAMGQRTLSWPKAEYAKKFDQIAHILVNHSPFMSWAFPRGLFFEFGLRFDEQLDVCEDWDMILRASLLVGVADVFSLTSIYRRWEGGSSSYTVHTAETWRESEKRVVDRLNSGALVLPAGSIEELREMQRTYVRRHLIDELELVTGSLSWRMTSPIRVVKSRIYRHRGVYLHHRNRLLRFLGVKRP